MIVVEVYALLRLEALPHASDSLTEDKIIWGYSKDGMYTVKSYCWWARNQRVREGDDRGPEMIQVDVVAWLQEFKKTD